MRLVWLISSSLWILKNKWFPVIVIIPPHIPSILHHKGILLEDRSAVIRIIITVSNPPVWVGADSGNLEIKREIAEKSHPDKLWS